jgi:hypothetical protein
MAIVREGENSPSMDPLNESRVDCLSPNESFKQNGTGGSPRWSSRPSRYKADPDDRFLFDGLARDDEDQALVAGAFGDADDGLITGFEEDGSIDQLDTGRLQHLGFLLFFSA